MNRYFEPQPVETPRDRLIEATIQEIERRGLSQLTVRGVAAAADMNIAAVNYHFRSKQALVAAALESTIVHMLADTDELLARLPQDPAGALSELLEYYLEGARRFPRISKAHLHDAFVADDYTGTLPRSFAPALRRLRDALCAVVPRLEPEPAARRVVAALSAVYFPAFFAGLFVSFALDTPAERSLYVQEIARRALAPVGSPELAPARVVARPKAARRRGK
jgi:TetR/AcrR family transcriptional regulator, regulator of cefoperazone and chloramphenicol sensitivity